MYNPHSRSLHLYWCQIYEDVSEHLITARNIDQIDFNSMPSRDLIIRGIRGITSGNWKIITQSSCVLWSALGWWKKVWLTHRTVGCERLWSRFIVDALSICLFLGSNHVWEEARYARSPYGTSLINAMITLGLHHHITQDLSSLISPYSSSVLWWPSPSPSWCTLDSAPSSTE